MANPDVALERVASGARTWIVIVVTVVIAAAAVTAPRPGLGAFYSAVGANGLL
jgi:hypothetical protein